VGRDPYQVLHTSTVRSGTGFTNEDTEIPKKKKKDIKMPFTRVYPKIS
jgi:hypothetical protein